MTTVFDPPAPILAPTSDGRGYPVRRVYCVGRNYAEHTREMGGDPDRDPPFFFTKWPDTVVPTGSTIVYPSETKNYHFEIELVVAIGKEGFRIAEADANDHIFAYGVGLDMTRRDLQAEAKEQGRPWDTGKNVDQSAPLSVLHPVSETGILDSGAIWLDVNGQRKQESDLSKLIWSVPEVISFLSGLYPLRPGDLIYTGTPAGVGPVVSGDKMLGHVDGLTDLEITIGDPQ